MKSVLDWVKSNILADIAILITVVSIAFMVYVYVQDRAMVAGMNERGRVVQQLATYTRGRVFIPSPNTNEPPREILNVTVNQATIEGLKSIRSRMRTEAVQTFSFLNQKNRGGRQLLMEGMLPNTRNLFNARQAYLDAFEKMLGPYQPTAGHLSLNAGLPPTSEKIAEELQKVRDQFMHLSGRSPASAQPPRPAEPPRPPDRFGRFSPVVEDRGPSVPALDTEGLSEDDRTRLASALRERLAGLLEEYAKSIHIYADPRMLNEAGAKNSAFPFQIASWALQDDGRSPGQLPTTAMIFEGQLEFWIQQDITQAIFIANGVDKEGTSVLTSPVKRLLRVDVLPGYVGLHNVGTAPRGLSQEGGGGNRGGATAAGGTLYPIPPEGSISSPDAPIADNFAISPTGKVSNAIFDVRHVNLHVVVDSTKLPQIYNAISSVNLMTVISTQLKDVDEAQAMREGYLYTGDAMEAQFVIETIWLRDWTREYMPEETRRYLGIQTQGQPRTN